jgi:hypothetical protein
MTVPERTLGAPVGTVIPPALAWRRAGHTETKRIVSVVGVVPVADAGAQVPRIVVPGPAADDTPTGGRPGSPDGSNHPSRKIAWRKRHVDVRGRSLEIAKQVAEQHVSAPVTPVFVLFDGAVRALARAVGVAVMDEAMVEQRFHDGAQRVMHDTVAEYGISHMMHACPVHARLPPWTVRCESR